jgi:hypothetical protein
MIKKAGVITLGMVLACVWFPRSSFSDNSGFYAGPLSVVAETIAEKTAEPAQDVTQKMQGEKQDTDFDKWGDNNLNLERIAEPGE